MKNKTVLEMMSDELESGRYELIVTCPCGCNNPTNTIGAPVKSICLRCKKEFKAFPVFQPVMSAK